MSSTSSTPPIALSPPTDEATPPRMVTVEDASPSPSPSPTNVVLPPLPEEPLPSGAERDLDEPDEDAGSTSKRAISNSAEGHAARGEEEEEEEEWDPSASSTTLLKDRRKPVAERRPVPSSSLTSNSASGSGSNLRGKAVSNDADDPTKGWQAIWAPGQNAYYFWNAKTGVTTWENPLTPPSAHTSATTLSLTSNPIASSSSSSTAHAQNDAQPPLPPASEVPPSGLVSSWGEGYGLSNQGGYASGNGYENGNGPGAGGHLPRGPIVGAYGYNGNGQPPLPGSSSSSALPPIDPDLALLLPGARAAALSSASSSQAPTLTAAFNTQTGRFTPASYSYTVDHLAEANRAKRQEGAFFDVDEWEKGREEEWREKGRKRKELEEGGGAVEDGPRKVSKKDMERFKAKAQEKKARTNAWLRQ